MFLNTDGYAFLRCTQAVCSADCVNLHRCWCGTWLWAQRSTLTLGLPLQIRVMAASQNSDKPQCREGEGANPGTRTLTPDEQDRMDRGVGAVGLSNDGAGCGGQWISSTTRHVHIFAGEIVNGDLDQSQLDKLTIDVDPDCEFNWNDSALNKVFAKFDEVVEQHAGAPLNDYTLRLIGSDVEHFIRKLLQKGEISYDLEHRALNYSMGRPRLPIEGIEDVKEASAAAAPVTVESPATVETA